MYTARALAPPSSTAASERTHPRLPAAAAGWRVVRCDLFFDNTRMYTGLSTNNSIKGPNFLFARTFKIFFSFYVFIKSRGIFAV